MDKQQILNSLDIATYYSRHVPGITWGGRAEGSGLCPFHPDDNPSFSVNRDSGKWFCHTGCGGSDVIAFEMKRTGSDFQTALATLAAEAGVSEESQKKKPTAVNKIVATYDYTDESGVMLYQAIRYEPKTFRQRRPDGNGGWIWNLDGVSLVPFNLPDVLKAKSVIVVEGEKDVESLRAWGLTATTGAMGAGKWKSAYNEHFKGRRVVILPDNDDPGRKHAHDVAANLYNAADMVKIVGLPGLPHKGDASDWIAYGGTKEQLIEMIKQADEWTPEASNAPVDAITELPEKNRVEVQSPSLCVVAIADFLRMTFPPREMLLSPILPSQGLAMLHAYRGIGKTHVSLGIAVAVASGGSFLKWKAEKPRGVLFLDGEMPAATIRDRLAKSILDAENEPMAPLNIVTPDLQERSMPDLSTPEGQRMLEPYLADIELVIADNISTLCRGGRENDAESWLPVQEWALRLRAMGKSVLFIHHDGKGGQQRGTTKKEDVLDTVISLRKPGDYQDREGARFEVHYEKHRGFHGDDAKPFEAQLIVEPSGTQKWDVRDLDDSLTERVARHLNDGIPQKELAELLGVAKGTVSKHKKLAQEQGLLKIVA